MGPLPNQWKKINSAINMNFFPINLLLWSNPTNPESKLQLKEPLWYQYFGQQGLELHVDPAASIGINLCISGKKLWVIFESILFHSLPSFAGFLTPEKHYHCKEVIETLAKTTTKATSVYVFEQNPGEILYVPPTCPHTVSAIQSESNVFVHNIVYSIVPPYVLPLHNQMEKVFANARRKVYFPVKHCVFTAMNDPSHRWALEERIHLFGFASQLVGSEEFYPNLVKDRILASHKKAKAEVVKDVPASMNILRKCAACMTCLWNCYVVVQPTDSLVNPESDNDETENVVKPLC